MTLLVYGYKGDEVKELQQLLHQAGLSLKVTSIKMMMIGEVTYKSGKIIFHVYFYTFC